MFRKIVKGAAKENNMLFLLGPIFCKAKNNRVSPKKTPIIPEAELEQKVAPPIESSSGN